MEIRVGSPHVRYSEDYIEADYAYQTTDVKREDTNLIKVSK